MNMISYGESKPSGCIADLDANNLYNWVMTQYLPFAAFRQIIQKELIDLM